MAFDVKFYTFDKQLNSTGRPSAAGVTYSCTLKAPTSLLSPTIILRLANNAQSAPVAYNYCYIAAWSRYYWINDWVNDGPLWEGHLTVDVLATYRDTIYNSTLYVSRSEIQPSDSIPDPLALSLTNRWVDEITIQRPWIGIPSSYDNGARGMVAACVANSIDGKNWYYFTIPEFNNFVADLMTDAFASQIIGDLQLALYPDTKIAVDPLHYILSAVYLPLLPSPTMFTNVSTILVATTSLSRSARIIQDDDFAFWEWTRTLDLTQCRHPDFGLHRWTGQAPWSVYELLFPPFGIMELDSAALVNADNLYIKFHLDLHTGELTLDVTCDNNLLQSARSGLVHATSRVGIDIPVAGVMTRQGGSGGLALNTMLGMAGSLATGNPAAAAMTAAQGAMNLLQDAAYARVPHLSTVGNVGSSSCLSYDGALRVTHSQIKFPDAHEVGWPNGSTVPLTAVWGGYARMPEADLSISGTGEEQQQMNSFLRGGVILA